MHAKAEARTTTPPRPDSGEDIPDRVTYEVSMVYIVDAQRGASLITFVTARPERWLVMSQPG